MAAELLLKRRCIRRSLIEWSRHCGYEPALHHKLLIDRLERDRLLLMGAKLYRFVTPIGLLAVLFGLWLWLGAGIGRGEGWMSAKFVVVVALVAYHVVCGRILTAFERNALPRSHVWFRWFNEIPVLLLLAAVILVVVKPF